MLTIHHLGTSQSERIVWLCEELDVPYELIRYERLPTQAAPPEYKALHPLGTAPTITDGNVTLAETGAIFEYISRKYGQERLTLSPEHPDFAQYLFWLHYPQGSILPSFMMDMVALRNGGTPGDRSDRAYNLIEQRLAEAQWLAGDTFTQADIMMGFVLTRLRVFSKRDLADYPHTRAYLARVAERPAFRRAMAKAEPDQPPLLS
jgi:glutathione S-transferase